MFPLARAAYKGLKKVFSRKRKSAKKRYTRKMKADKPFMVKKTVLLDKVDLKSNSTVFGSTTFEFTDLPQYANYAALYEEFKIVKVVVSFKSMANNEPNFINSGTVTTGIIHTIVDTNDDTAPSTIQSMMNDPTYRCTRLTKWSHTRVIYPKFLSQVGGAVAGGAGSVSSRQGSGWLKCINGGVYNAVSHYGLKNCFEGGVNSAGNYTAALIEPQITYYIAFRNPA